MLLRALPAVEALLSKLLLLPPHLPPVQQLLPPAVEKAKEAAAVVAKEVAAVMAKEAAVVIAEMVARKEVTRAAMDLVPTLSRRKLSQ